MATRAEYLRLATEAYEKYVKVQREIQKYETEAKFAYGNSSLAAQRLKFGDQYWRYRELCGDRTMLMAVAQLNASMAAVTGPTLS